jgi:hypothetical protein
MIGMRVSLFQRGSSSATKYIVAQLQHRNYAGQFTNEKSVDSLLARYPQKAVKNIPQVILKPKKAGPTGTQKNFFIAFLPYLAGVVTFTAVVNFGYAALSPAYREFFSDRNPMLGQLLDHVLGSRDEDLTPIESKVDIKEFVKSIQSDKK